jgi:phosphoglycolate phosphatase-like HAD superfamily hydrolase
MIADDRTLLRLTDRVLALTAIVCDWNGTLVDDAERARVATNRTIDGFGINPLNRRAFSDQFKLPMAGFFEGLRVPPAEIDTAVRTWNAYMVGGEFRLGRGATELLAAARSLGLPVGVVSAADTEVVRADAAYLGIEGDLAFIRGGATDKAAAIAALVRQYGETVVYVGDTEYDILSAKQAGAIAIAFTGGYRPAEALRSAAPAAVIDDFFQLARLLATGRED